MSGYLVQKPNKITTSNLKPGCGLVNLKYTGINLIQFKSIWLAEIREFSVKHFRNSKEKI